MSTSHHYTTRLTPTSTQGRGKLVEHNDGSLCFVAEVVIGSSVLSINSLSASTETNTFAFCAGAIVVLAVINSELSLDQRLVCVKPDALPIQATPSYYNHATPTKAAGNRNYINSPFKDDSPFGPALINNKADPFGKPKLAHRSRNVTSISLSPSGRYLAIGEVVHHRATRQNLRAEDCR